MNGAQLFALLGDLPDDLIVEAETARGKKSPGLLRWAALAACAALVIFAGSLFLRSQPKSAPEAPAMAPDSAAPEAAPADTPPAAPEAPAGGSMTASPDYGVAGDANAAGGEGADAPPGFWNANSLHSSAVTVYVPAEAGWRGVAVTDGPSIQELYTRLFLSDPQVVEPSGLPPAVLVDLQNGFALSLRQLDDGTDEATLYTVPDQKALTDELSQGQDPWPHLTETDPAVRYTTELTAYVLELLP